MNGQTSYPLVSVIMPSYNHVRFIREAIDSVLNQSYPNIEIIVMDGGSTDGTKEILESYGDSINFVSKPDEGQSDAINKGFAKAQGEILCWLNSDDLFEPDAIDHVVRYFEQDPSIDFLYGNGYQIDVDSERLGVAGVRPYNIWKLVHHRNIIQQPSLFFTRKLLDRAGDLDKSLYYIMDWELWIRFALYGKGIFVPDYFSSNRVYSANKTMRGKIPRWNEIRKIIRKYSNMLLPPVIVLYFLEANLQIFSQVKLAKLYTGVIKKLFFGGINKEFSGVSDNGEVGKKFHFSIGNPSYSGCKVHFQFIPVEGLQRIEMKIEFRWRSSTGENGRLDVFTNGGPQEFELAINKAKPGQFIHLTLKTSNVKRYLAKKNKKNQNLVIGSIRNVRCERLI